MQSIVNIVNVLTASAVQQFKTSIARPMFRFCVIAQPIIFGLLLGFMYMEKTSEDFTVYALLGSGLASFWGSICFSSASDIHRERWYGTLENIYAAPIGFKWIVLGKIIGNSVWGFLSLCLSFTVVSIFFNKTLIVAHPIILIAGILLMTFSLVAIGFLFAALFTLSRNARVMMNFMEYPVYILCGMLFPLELLPKILYPISYSFSPTWAVKIIRFSVSGGELNSVLFYFVGLIIITIIYSILSVVMFNRIDVKCRIDATLEVY